MKAKKKKKRILHIMSYRNVRADKISCKVNKRGPFLTTAAAADAVGSILDLTAAAAAAAACWVGT